MGMSKHECRINDHGVEFAADIPLDTIDKQLLLKEAQKFLRRYDMRLSLARLRLHLKRESRRIACHIQFLTDRGVYVTHVVAWETQIAFAQALENIELQLRKSFDMQNAHAVVS